MPDNKLIQIKVDNPCSQDWDKMTVTEQGRHCAHCNRNVIDFTGYSDAALHQYFSKNTGHICGRFLPHQLNRDIAVTPQPHSRLYRLFIGLGLVLVFTQIPAAHAQRSPVITDGLYNKKDTGLHWESSAIKGRILDGSHPVANVKICAMHDGLPAAITITDTNGYYFIPLPVTGRYMVKASFNGKEMLIAQSAFVMKDAATRIDFTVPLSLDASHWNNHTMVLGSTYR